MRRSILCLMTMLSLAMAGKGHADILAGWDVNGVNVGAGTGLDAGGTPYAFTAGTKHANIADAKLTLGAGVNPSTAENTYGFKISTAQTSLAGAITETHYIQFTLAAANGFVLNLTSLDMIGGGTSTGAKNIDILTSVDGFQSDNSIASLANANADYGFDARSSSYGFGAPIVLDGAQYQGISSITFRIYGWNTGGNTGATSLRNLGGNDLVINGTVTATKLAAPVANSPSTTNVNNFTASWGPVVNATGYALDVASGSNFLTTDFEGDWPPVGWVMNSIDPKTTYAHGGTNSALFSAMGDYLITPQVAFPGTLTFWNYSTSTNPLFVVETCSSLVGSWSAVPEGSLSGNTNWTQRTVDLSSTSSVYIKLRRTGGSGNLYIDDVDITDLGIGVFVAGYENRTVSGGATVSSVVTGLVSGTTYRYRVRSVGEYSTSENSSMVTVQTLTMPAPTAMAASSIGSGGFDANWSSVAEAVGYRLDVSTNLDGATYVAGYQARDLGPVMQATVTGLLAQVTYYYRVRAYDAGSMSLDSNVQSLTTGLKGEPSNHATGFSSGTVTHRTIPLIWTDATAGTMPDGYLVRGSTNGFDSIAAPVDGVNVAVNLTWTGGVYANRITPGAQVDVVSGLTAGQTFCFKLFPYSVLSGVYDYKTDGSVPQLMVSTLVDVPFEDMENVVQLNYTSGTVALLSGNWGFVDALLGTIATDKRNDQKAARIQNSGSLTMEFDVTAVETLSMEHANYGTETGGKIRVYISTDSGNNWFPLGSEVTCGAAFQTASFSVHYFGPMRFRIVKTAGAAGTRINIDDVRMTPYLPVPTVFRFR